MKIGLIDVDGHNYPNIPLMKLSAWHKQRGDSVEWYQPMFSGHLDRVYMSKVFSFTPDYEYFVDADEIIKGGSGYCISMVNGKEIYDSKKDTSLPYEIEHIYPDYSIYGITDTAYGFMSRGCPRQCSFCHVKDKPADGIHARKVADLSEFWNGQKYIELCDPNTLACCEWKDILQQLIDSKATVNFNQGLDIRMMTEEKARMISKIKLSIVHFAWDRYEDKELIQPKLKMFKDITQINIRKAIVYVLCGYQERRVLPEDLERIYWLRDNGYWPYVMLYDKDSIPRGHELRLLQRWVNNRYIFPKVKRFEDYREEKGKGKVYEGLDKFAD